MIIVVEPTIMLTRFTAFGDKKSRSVEWKHEHASGKVSPAEKLRGIVAKLAGRDTIEAIAFHLHFGDSGFASPAKVTPEFIDALAKTADVSPLYVPAVCAHMRLFLAELKDVPMFAYSETSLFSRLPAREKRYPIARQFFGDGDMMKRGFHGIFHGMHATLFSPEDRVISVVMDRSTTVSAIRGGRPESVSFGVTPLEGIMSARSCGDVDPGIIVYLMKEQGLSIYRVDDILKKESGFYGMTGRDLPPEKLIELYGREPAVTLAFDVYKNQILKYIGDSITVMGGFDKIVFAGANVAPLHQIVYRLMKDLSFMGVSLAELPWKQEGDLYPITAKDSVRQVYVNTLDEADIIYRKTRENLAA